MDPIRSTPEVQGTRFHPIQSLTQGRATLLKRATQHVNEAQKELLSILNAPLFQHLMPGEVIAVTRVQSDVPMVMLESGFERPLLPLLPPDFQAQADMLRDMPVRSAVIDAGMGLLFTAAAACWMGFLAIAVSAGYFLHKAAYLMRVAFAKEHVRQLDDAASRVRALVEEMRDWSQRGEDAMDTRGVNLQQIYEERRDRTQGLGAALRAP